MQVRSEVGNFMERFTEEEMAEPNFKDGKLYWCVFGLLKVSSSISWNCPCWDHFVFIDHPSLFTTKWK